VNENTNTVLESSQVKRSSVSVVFQWQLFLFMERFLRRFQGFCPVYDGSKNVKLSGVGSPFSRNLMGNLKLWGGISCLLTNFRGRSDTPSMRGHRPSLTSETQSPSHYGWTGSGNYLKKNFQQFSFRPPLKKLWTVY